MLSEPTILIVDLGSQYTLLIARSLRESGYRSVVLSPEKAGVWLKYHKPGSIILSGSDKSVLDEDAPQPPQQILDSGVPVLGICYGMQWIASQFGGKVARETDHVEYGPATITIRDADSPLFSGITGDQNVYASHGDSVVMTDMNFKAIAANEDGHGYRAIHYRPKNFWGVQFHPEVPHTPCGKQLLVNFVNGICSCEPDWEPADIVSDIRTTIADDQNVRALLGFSGGVDSTTMAAVLSPAMGDRLLGVCIDGGHLREKELDEIQRHADAAGITLKVIDARSLFAELLKGITDAEKKRKAFKEVYLRLLKEAAADFEATHVVQGTLATDLIESGATGGDLIKSHHNVGLDWGDLGELAPLSPFFKYEVRALAAELDLPESVIDREPFPGPGLFLRVFGGEITSERLDIARWADYEVRKILADAKNTPEISQLVVGLNCTNTTGVKGDGRAYGPAIVVRAVHTSDFMTAAPVFFPQETMEKISSVVTRHPGVVRVWWDFNAKPPATTEFE